MKKIFLLLILFLLATNSCFATETMTLKKAYKQITIYSRNNDINDLNEFFIKYPKTKKVVYYNSENLLKKCLKKEYSSEVFAILVKNGLALNCLNKHPLITAIEQGDEALVKVILESNIDVDMYCIGRKTPLFYAADTGNPHLVKMLLNADANANTTDNAGNTPLLLVCRYSPHSKAIYYLIDAGADLYAYNKHNKMPYNVLPSNMRQNVKTYYDKTMTNILTKKYVDKNKNMVIADFGTPNKRIKIDKTHENWEYEILNEHYMQMIADTSATSSTSSITIVKGGYTEKVTKKISFLLTNDCVSSVSFASRYNTGR